MVRPKKWSDEQKDILNKCKVKDIYNYTKSMFDMSYDELKLISELNLRKLSDPYRYKGLSEKEVLDLRQKYQTIYKQAQRVISYKMDRDNRLRQSCNEDELEILNKIDNLTRKVELDEFETRLLEELRDVHRELRRKMFEVIERENYMYDEDKCTEEEDEEIYY